jgi:hypothetical protein
MIGVLARDAAAQASVSSAKAARWEISGGGVFAGGVDLGEETAELTSNTGTSGSPSTFFVTDSRMKPAFGVQARMGFFLTRLFAIEGGARFTKPTFEIRTSHDVESAADVTAEETLSQYLFDGSAVWHFKDGIYAKGAVPFLFGGAGYLRELHEGGALVEEAAEYHAGGGVKWWFGWGVHKLGLRAEAGFSVRDDGADVEKRRHVVPVAAGSLTWRF